MNIQKNGGAIIQEIIDSACKDGSYKAIISGRYEIEKTIVIPSGFYLVLENCYLRMADDTFCNMFTNYHCHTEIGKTKDGTDYDITIEGRGCAVLDGGTYNGLGERNSGKDGNPPVYFNNTILFTNVERFKISGLSVKNQRWWAMNFIFCSHGKIRDIDFCSNPLVVDENGNTSVGFANTTNQETHLVKNGDGIDIRSGCHDIIIENITGFCEDDTIAVTGLWGNMEKTFGVPGKDKHIHNIIIRNINACSYCAIVRLLNQSGVKLYNVLVDGIVDSSDSSEYMDRGLFGVRIGDKYLYGDRMATKDECFNITVRNVFTRAKCTLSCGGDMKNVVVDNLKVFDKDEIVIENYTEVPTDELLNISK